MIAITIGIAFFLIGTFVSYISKKRVLVLISFTFGYIFLIIGSYANFLNFLLLWICLALNILGLIKMMKKS